MNRRVKTKVRGVKTKDGAGVNLVRVLGNGTVNEFDPILMLDSFDSTNPDDYTAGFPMHPHRGIETISYVYKGKMKHRDSLGFEDTVEDGEVQWMTAGSGILHEELLPESQHLIGVQLWLNLPQDEKMTAPEYHSIKNSQIKEFEFQGKHLPFNYYDIELDEKSRIEIETNFDDSVMIFTLLSDVFVEGEEIKEKTAVKLTKGDSITIESGEKKAKVLFMSSRACLKIKSCTKHMFYYSFS